MSSGNLADRHVSSDQVAAFIDGRLSGAERERAIGHLADCAECRVEVADVRGLIVGAGAGRTRRWTIAVGAIAAAVAFAVAVPRLDSEADLAAGAGRMRAAAGVTAIAVLSPVDGATTDRAALRLAWEGVGADAVYLVTVMDSSGTPVWSVRASETSITVPDDARLLPGVRYFWSVDARLVDGTSARTGAHEFTLR